MALILGIDPGLTGALVLTNGSKSLSWWLMPVKGDSKKREIDFDKILWLLLAIKKRGPFKIYLERAVPMAMGSMHAFNYGRGFAALEIAIKQSEVPVTYIEPAKWTKIMHEGISSDLKPKAKSLLAVERLFPSLVNNLPRNRNDKLLEGPVDALLIAGYGLRNENRVDAAF